MVSGGRLLLEREAELDRLGSLAAAAAGGKGGVAVLAGPAGIGKTWLARAAREEAERTGLQVLAARGAELERDYAFGVVRQWFESVARGGAGALAGAAAHAGPVLGGDPADARDPSFSVLHGLYWFAAGLAERQPLALVLDDAQWSDDASLRFVDFLARRLDGLPVLLLLTVREPLAGLVEQLAAEPATEVLGLPPLGAEAVGAFLHARTDGAVDAAFAAACREATGGNPFLLGELAQALVAEEVAFVAAEKGRVRSVGPRSVATAVHLRLARLAVEATRLARAAAVAGSDAALPLVATVAGLSEPEADEAADELARAGVLEDGRPLRFVHPIVEAAIRESLLAGERQALHARAAEALAQAGAPPEAVAVHLRTLDPSGDEQVAATLAEAGRRALAEGAADAAAALLQRALAEPPPAAMLPRVLLALGEAEHALERTSAPDRLREAYRLAADPRDRAQAALLLTWAVVSAPAEPRDVSELLERSIAELGDADHDLALRLEAAWLGVAWDRGDRAAVLARAERYAGLEGRTPGECLVLAYLAHTLMDDGRPAHEALAVAERAARREFLRELSLNSIWLIHAGIVLSTAERLDAYRRLCDDALAEAQAAGSLRAYLLASMYRSAALHRAGDIPGAEADARAALEGGARELVLLPAVNILVLALVEQGRLNEALRLLEQHGLAEQVPDFRHATPLLFGRARLRHALGDLRGALDDLAEARRRLDRSGARLGVVGIDNRWLTALSLRGLGETDAAEREALVAVEAARAWGTPGAIGTALHALAVARDDLELLREAVERLGESPLRLRHARGLVELGAMLRRSGLRSESRTPLREGLELAHECGATALRERAREELAASGVRVRRETSTGADSLTPSERRIAERAAAGASNPEIAQSLFVTVKTVEMHLSNAYRKLGISGRRELAGALVSIHAD